ncbi:hypothetical protein [Microbacterium trichothecenolyticum]|uniref:MYXO-CTERM domain-containing protein n=1 Tax=Microbacterium trichothecenolyticum TaxID=69370 RepID=A0ABU0TZ02_MICTR|nr:hypothetical protein [Microbacterium trichothecenolyticum]MDQ1124884.1 hypothetical protein [Microbacterium trichothecenolyticum]
MSGRTWAGVICVAVILPFAVAMTVHDFSVGQFPARPVAIIVLVIVGVVLWLRRNTRDDKDA